MTAEERLIAYLDGELPSDARAAFEAEIAADPALAADVDRHRALAARVAEAYAPVLGEPIPPRLMVLASAANDPEPRRLNVRPWAALAASLVLGVAAGHELWPHAGPLTVQDGALVARGDLAKALTTQLASQSVSGTVKVGLSFRASDGRLCRTFQSRADRLAGLACRADGHWVAEVASALSPRGQTDYRTAASDTPPAVLAAVDAMISGQALDAAQERAARDGGWR